MRKTLAALAGTAILLGGASRAYASPNSGYSSVPSYSSIAVVDPASLFFLAVAGVTAIAKLGKHLFPGRGRIPSDDEIRKSPKDYPGACEVTRWDQAPNKHIELPEITQGPTFDSQGKGLWFPLGQGRMHKGRFISEREFAEWKREHDD